MKENNINHYIPGDLDILYEDNHLIIINKTNRDLVQGDKTGDKSLDQQVKDYIKDKYNKPGEVFLGVAHRLDRPVSGAVIFARTSKALARLNKMFQENKMKKVYWAITRNLPRPESGTLLHYISRNTKQNKSYCHETEGKNSKKAELDYQLIGRSDSFFLIEVILKTGRHHQIRAQLSKIGCPIKGDLKYGAKRSNANGGISLHARSIEFEHPVKKVPIKVEAKPPEDESAWQYFNF